MSTAPVENDALLSEVYSSAVARVRELQDTTFLPKSPEYRKLHTQCLDTLALCASKIEKLNLFNDDEELGDLPNTSLNYMTLDYLFGIVLEKTPIDPSKTTHISRLSVSKLAIRKYMDFANLLVGYEVTDHGIFSNFLEKSFPNGPQGQFVLDPDTSVDSRTKVNNTRQLNQYRVKLRGLLETNNELKINNDNENQDDDDDDAREIQVTRLQIYLAKAWFAVQGALEELQLLCAMMPDNRKFLKFSKTSIPSSNLDSQAVAQLVSSSAIGPTFEKVMEDLDERTKQKEEKDKNSTRVDITDNAKGGNGKLIGPGGKVNRPFVISDRKDILKNVQGTGQVLPTMTVEELVEKELANSIRSNTVNDLKREEDEEDEEDSDEQIMKQRQWDDFRDSTPRGSGNTMNLG